MPSAANAVAMASPIPLAAPVTTATRPSSCSNGTEEPVRLQDLVAEVAGFEEVAAPGELLAGPSSTTSPWFITYARSATVRAMWMCCSTSSTPAPVSSAICRTSGSMRSTMMGARPRLISSIISTFGWATRARATASICCSPPDNRPALRSLSGAQGGEHLQGPVVGLLLRSLDAAQAEAQVLVHGELEEQRPVLRHMTEAASSHPVRRAVVDRLAEDRWRSPLAPSRCPSRSGAWWSCRRRWGPAGPPPRRDRRAGPARARPGCPRSPTTCPRCGSAHRHRWSTFMAAPRGRAAPPRRVARPGSAAPPSRRGCARLPRAPPCRTRRGRRR